MIMDSNKLFDYVVGIMSKWLPKGEKILANGVRLICPTPHIALEAWLHVLYPPLGIEKIEQMENMLGSILPSDFKYFLQKANGLQMFSCCISIWGVRMTMARTGDEAWQPYDLVDHNYVTERPLDSPENVIYFASVDPGGFWCFFEFSKGNYRVGKTDRYNFHPDYYWPDFGSWLIEEVESVETFFNSNGEMKVGRDIE